jgi:thiol-disulfide isomerase/thioredoxin
MMRARLFARRSSGLLAALLFCLAAASALFCAATPRDELSLKDGSGRTVRLRDLRGKAVVLNFWATWCGPCNAEMTMLAEIQRRYAGRSVVFIGASLDNRNTRAKIPAFIDGHQIGFPIWYGATLEDMEDLDMGNAVPATAFLDAEGRIVSRIRGQAQEDEIKERIEWLTGGVAGPAPPPRVVHLER